MKNKIATIIIALLMSTVSFSVFLTGVSVGLPDIAGPMFAGGDGSIGDPYQITNVDELQEMNTDLNANYSLMNDIDASATTGWPGGFAPVGNDTSQFNGSLEGNGFQIIDMTINAPGGINIGLFGHINIGAEVKSVGLVNVSIVSDSSTGGIAGTNYGNISYSYATGIINCNTGSCGGLAGKNYGNISNSYSMVNIYDPYFATVGGFVGINFPTGIIENCYSTGTLFLPGWGTVGPDIMGGFVGNNQGIINNSFSTGSVLDGRSLLGGFAGTNDGGIITNCYSTGSVTGSLAGSSYYVGGFVGQNNGNVSNCFSTGDANGDEEVGGFAGQNNGDISNCHSTGNAGMARYAGGFVGRNSGPITDSYSTGRALGLRDQGTAGYVGGFAGWNEHNITRCYSTGDAVGDDVGVGGFIGQNQASAIVTNCYSLGSAIGNSIVGGFIGSNGGSISNSYCTGPSRSPGTHYGFAESNAGSITDCFWDTTVSETATSTGGTGMTTLEMKQQIKFDPPWDFDNVWGIVETETYPFLTTINPIVMTKQVTEIDNSMENVFYSVYFDSEPQPINNFDSPTFSLSTNANWLYISPIYGHISGTPSNNDVGTFWVNVIATDPFGNQGQYNYTLTVSNTGPDITTNDVTTSTEDTLYEVDYDSTDDPSTTWNLITDASWLSISSPTGILSGTPGDSDSGIYSIEVIVNDGNGGTDSQAFTLTVNDVPPPTDTDGDGTPDGSDADDDGDGWDDAIEIAGGFDPLDNSSMPSDADSDGIADFMDPDFLTVTEYNNQTVWDNETADLNTDSDSDGWTDIEEILAGTDEHDDTDMPSDVDDDGIADFMDSDFLTTEVEVPVYNNNTIWNNGTADSETASETPAWAWGAVIAAVVMGVLAVIGFTRGDKGGGKPEGVERVPEAETEAEEPPVEEDAVELEPEG